MGLLFPVRLAMVKRPPVILIRSTLRSEGAEEDAGAGAAGAASPDAPRLEKFHTPAAFCIRSISGFSIMMPVTFSLRDMISGISSTPALSELARRKGVL